MPEQPQPNDLVACRFGSLFFHLPPELAQSHQLAPNGPQILGLGDGSRSMIIALPTDTTGLEDFLRTDLRMPPQGEDLSTVMRRLACIQTGFDEFRWPMSRGEVRWHAWRMTVGQLAGRGGQQRAETLITNNLEGVAYFRSKRVEFDWQPKEGRASGYIHFIDGFDEQEIDPAWVYAVCRSLIEACIANDRRADNESPDLRAQSLDHPRIENADVNRFSGPRSSNQTSKDEAEPRFRILTV